MARELAPSTDGSKGFVAVTKPGGLSSSARTRARCEGAMPEVGSNVWEVDCLVDRRRGKGGRPE